MSFFKKNLIKNATFFLVTLFLNILVSFIKNQQLTHLLLLIGNPIFSYLLVNQIRIQTNRVFISLKYVDFKCLNDFYSAYSARDAFFIESSNLLSNTKILDLVIKEILINYY